ncbi:biotin carboxylase N-terminal domain-containing protein [Litoribrevibacter albus]|uniref:Carbamoyl phosphate synthase large subunit n=1 Tax=Litoribrevibacter albus TaxID=1473156 RepID=A0AA37S944_9GAMM|nr:biotin carboxylase N-terminal domain-containing protein [Litoribrevibacter albus]GLQ30699.1 carbamoyl phosphate synthase large subunit [Litoribrevibacter albus]
MFDIEGEAGLTPQDHKENSIEKTTDNASSDAVSDSTSDLTIRCDRKALGIETLNFAGGPFLDKDTLIQKLNVIKSLANATYAEQVLKPVDDIKRPSALSLVHKMADRILKEEQLGPLCLLNIELCDAQSAGYEVAVVVQNRSVRNGVWSPKHHNLVNTWLSEVSAKRLPVVTFIDTPGADAGNQANMEFQAGSISKLITGFTRLDVPSIGVIYGKGYSGGAIPLAATNLLFALKDGVFSTIQPQGLAAIARRENLSWQECAQKVGISAVELVFDGVLDGVIDYSPLDANAEPQRVKEAILAGLMSLSQTTTSVDPLSENTFAENAFSEDAFLEKAGSEETLTEGEKTDPIHIRDLRWQTLRSRLSFQEPHYEQTASSDRIHIQIQPRQSSAIAQDNESLQEQDSERFAQWLSRSQPLRYHKGLEQLWKAVQSDDAVTSEYSGRIGQSIDDLQFQKIEALSLGLAIEFFHQWQDQLGRYLNQFRAYLEENESITLAAFLDDTADAPLSLTDFVAVREIQELVLHHLELLKLLDVNYDVFLTEICSIAWEYSLKQTLSVETVQKLLRSAQVIATEQGIDRERAQRFLNWLHHLNQQGHLETLVARMNDWKQRQFPQTDSVLLVVAGYFISTLLTRLYWHQVRGIPFSGAFQPTRIGRQKNFWHRLTQASRNVRIQQLLDETKSQRMITPTAWIELLFESFQPLDQDLVTKDPKVFPGFAKRINQALDNGGTPCGLITGVGALKQQLNTQVGLFVSNSDFQAGAFDMASAEKLCRLLERASVAGIPVIGLVSSAGMQTKEGASALFSMAVVNEAISRFTDAGGRMMIIGYGDCTGGAQASFVTHSSVDTYYLSGTNLPFAGQVVVPEHLTLQATLSNYLVERTWGDKDRNVMRGLIRHPFFAGLDRRLQEIDPTLPLCELTLNDVLDTWLTENAGTQATSLPEVKQKQYGKIKQLLIHARGCTALRLIEAAHTANKQVVLVQSDPDMSSVAADSLGAGDRLVCLGGQSSEESYLNAHSVLRVAELEGVDALHPGIGFLSENADFAAACLEKDLNFIGPDASAISRMGDKAQAIATAKAAHVPTVPGSNGVVANLAHAHQVMNDIGVPLLIKASHGGGGKGIGTVQTPEELEHVFLRVQQEAKSAFGCGDVYIERLLQSVRHIEVQILRDSLGSFRMMGVRDCSAQRNRQKIIEESGEYVLTQDQIHALKTWSEGLSQQINYVGAGTLEFLFDLERDCFYFMEMNTRLQVEHIVTEMTSGVDLVEQQFRIAEGLSIADIPEDVSQNGHAIEVRVNAESISKDEQSGELVVTPATGTFKQVHIPSKPYARVLSVAAKGKEMTPFYDNLVAQVVVHGKDRAEAVARLSEYLDEMVISGVDTNLPLIKVLLKSEDFIKGDISTAFVEQWVSDHGESLSEVPQAQSEPMSRVSKFIEHDGSEFLLKLPSTGVVYAAPSPENPPFVKPGDVISGNQTLLLLEVMKMFMPITLSQFFKNSSSEDKYQVMHCRDLDGQYLQQGEVILTLKQL